MEPRTTDTFGVPDINFELDSQFTKSDQSFTSASVNSDVTSQNQSVTNESIINNPNVRRSTTSLEDIRKYKCTITSDRLAQLKKNVENAVKEHKTFTIKGGWHTLRNCLLRRNWIEKFEPSNNQKKAQSANPANRNGEDIVGNLPNKQDWESHAAYVAKCEKTIMSRLLAHHDVDFYWNMRKDQADWHHRARLNQLMNRFQRSLYTSKEGLALLLLQMQWFNEPGVSTVNFPRCYVLGFTDHYQQFIDDFRQTACISLLKWFVENYQQKNEDLIKSPDGQVPFAALQFALDRCNESIASSRHMDIDRDFVRTWNHEWDEFLTNYYKIVHHHALFKESKEFSLNAFSVSAKTTLREIRRTWPDFHIDGVKNIWILKPGNKCRGRGIQLVRHIEDVAKIMSMKLKFVVQKYIERPLLIYKTKFDIRQWFLISSLQPLVIWIYRENYLRFSSQIFSLDNFHESLHLTNHAIQCKYTNVNQRDKALPDENMWDCHTFQAYLRQIGHIDKWSDIIVPGIRQCIIGAILASQDTMDRRPNTFELYGADFMISDDFTPWLIEINSSPDLSPSTSVTARMCPQVLEDLIKVIIDKRRDPKAETGMFEMIYKQTSPCRPSYFGINLAVRGRRILKSKNKSHKKEEIKHHHREIIKRDDFALAQLTPSPPPDLYKGPIIEDFIQGLQHNLQMGLEHGVNFVPAIASAPIIKKKNERVSKSSHNHSVSLKNNSSYRKQSDAEKTRKMQKLNRTRLGFYNDWVKNQKIRDEICDYKKLRTTWARKTENMQKKTNREDKNNNINDPNKFNIKKPLFVSSLSLHNLLPHIDNTHANVSVKSRDHYLLNTTGISCNRKSALKSKITLPSSVQNICENS